VGSATYHQGSRRLVTMVEGAVGSTGLLVAAVWEPRLDHDEVCTHVLQAFCNDIPIFGFVHPLIELSFLKQIEDFCLTEPHCIIL